MVPTPKCLIQSGFATRLIRSIQQELIPLPVKLQAIRIEFLNQPGNLLKQVVVLKRSYKERSGVLKIKVSYKVGEADG